MTRLSMNIYEAKTGLSNLVRKVQQGNVVTLCKNGNPVAQIIPFRKKQNCWEKRGMARDVVGPIPTDFNEELTDADLPGFGLTPA